MLDDENVYMIVQDMPMFPGGDVMTYIARNVKYPPVARDMGISGTVYAEFVITKTGEAESINIIRKPEGGEALATEVERILNNMPRWFPGFQGGRPVSVRFTIPVKFTLK